MKSLATAITIPFLFATLFLSFTLAACGTADTPICSSIFGMSSRACDKSPLEHHTAIVEQSTLCTLDALGNAAALFVIIMVMIAVTTTLLSRVVHVLGIVNENLLRIFHIMNPFDPLRFAFIEGRVQQKRDVRGA